MYDAGQYWVRITAQQLAKNKDGDGQLMLNIAIMGPINPADPDGDPLGCPDGERTIYITFRDDRIQYAMRDLAFLGYDKTSFAYLDPAVQSGHISFVSDVRIPVKCRHYFNKNGEEKEAWNLDYATQQSFTPLDTAGVRKLDALFEKQLKALGNSAAEKPKRSVKQVEQTEQAEQVDPNTAMQEAAATKDDDLPF